MIKTKYIIVISIIFITCVSTIIGFLSIKKQSSESKPTPKPILQFQNVPYYCKSQRCTTEDTGGKAYSTFIDCRKECCLQNGTSVDGINDIPYCCNGYWHDNVNNNYYCGSQNIGSQIYNFTQNNLDEYDTIPIQNFATND
jgi:hypothetical protein